MVSVLRASSMTTPTFDRPGEVATRLANTRSIVKTSPQKTGVAATHARLRECHSAGSAASRSTGAPAGRLSPDSEPHPRISVRRGDALDPKARGRAIGDVRRWE